MIDKDMCKQKKEFPTWTKSKAMRFLFYHYPTFFRDVCFIRKSFFCFRRPQIISDYSEQTCSYYVVDMLTEAPVENLSFGERSDILPYHDFPRNSYCRIYFLSNTVDYKLKIVLPLIQMKF